MERWRRPPEVLDLAHHPLELIQLEDGRVFRAAEVVLAMQDIERMRQGYLCARCFEPFEEAWPPQCPVCGAPVALRQAEFFAREFSEERLGSRVSLAEEQASLPERVEREEQS